MKVIYYFVLRQMQYKIYPYLFSNDSWNNIDALQFF